MLISKKVGFDAAHFLPSYQGKCKDTHGHHWVVEVACSGDIRKDTGMVVDFADLKKFLNWIDKKFDHKLLNDFIPNPTAENIAKYIYDEFSLWCVAKGLKFKYIRVWETETSMVEYGREDLRGKVSLPAKIQLGRKAEDVKCTWCGGTKYMYFCGTSDNPEEIHGDTVMCLWCNHPTDYWDAYKLRKADGILP